MNLTKYFRKNETDAKFSSVLLLSAFLSFFIIDIILFLGLIYKDNTFSRLYIEGEATSNIIVMVLSLILIYIRYYKFITPEKIEGRIINLKTNNCLFILIKLIFIASIIAIPICYFLFFRLNKFGYI